MKRRPPGDWISTELRCRLWRFLGLFLLGSGLFSRGFLGHGLLGVVSATLGGFAEKSGLFETLLVRLEALALSADSELLAHGSK
jgi:hypothetical protein